MTGWLEPGGRQANGKTKWTLWRVRGRNTVYHYKGHVLYTTTLFSSYISELIKARTQLCLHQHRALRGRGADAGLLSVLVTEGRRFCWNITTSGERTWSHSVHTSTSLIEAFTHRMCLFAQENYFPKVLGHEYFRISRLPCFYFFGSRSIFPNFHNVTNHDDCVDQTSPPSQTTVSTSKTQVIKTTILKPT